MIHNDPIKGMQKTSAPLITSIIIISFRLFTRSIKLPDQVFVTSIASGRIIYIPATAAADPVKFRMDRFSAIK